MRLLHATNLCTDKCVDTLMNHGNPVDGRNPAPVEGKVVFSHYLQGFSTIPGGWEWDFFQTINSHTLLVGGGFKDFSQNGPF